MYNFVMKRIFNLIMIFFALAIALLLEPNSFQNQQVDAYVQNVKSETVVLASNTLLGGEIYSNQEENFPNYSGGTPFLVSFISKDNSYCKNKTQLNGSFIHNLSTSKQKVHQIRAP